MKSFPLINPYIYLFYFLKELLSHILIADLINSAKLHCYSILRLMDSFLFK